jgi:hypothetical protein
MNLSILFIHQVSGQFMLKVNLQKYWLTVLLVMLTLFLLYWVWTAWQEILLLVNDLIL